MQERTFRRLGGSGNLLFDAHLILATNRNLIAEVHAGRFRKDLYYRIATNEIHVPPLREREDDLWLLIDNFLLRFGGNRTLRLARETKAILARYRFPGNVRELRGIIQHAASVCQKDEVLPYDLPLSIMHEREAEAEPDKTKIRLKWPQRLLELPQKEALQEIENSFNQNYLPMLMEQAGGNVTQASRTAGLDPKTFRKKWIQAKLPKFSKDH